MKDAVSLNQTKKYFGWLDTLKGICAILVVLVHCQKPEMYAFLFRPFFLMSFFFAGGYTLKDRKGFIRKQFVTALQVITLAITFDLAYHLLINKTFLGYDRIIGAYLQSHSAYPRYAPIIWFIPCLCIGKSIFQIILRVAKDNKKTIVLLMLLCTVMGYWLCSRVGIFLPWHIQIALLIQIFIGMGYFYRCYEDKINPYCMPILCGAIIIYVCLIMRGPLAGDLALMKVSDWPRYMLCAIIGTIMMVGFAKKFDNKVCRYIGRNLLFMFVFQNYYINGVYAFINSIGASNEPKTVTSLFVTGCTITMLCCWAYLRTIIYDTINEKFNLKLKPIV